MENTKVGNKKSNGRPWTWTPPPAVNRMVSTLLRLPVAHRLISKMLLLLTFTGRQSGKRYSIPVGYYREGNTVMIITKRFRKWWRNLEGNVPVEVRIEGRNIKGQATALTEPEITVPIIAHIVEEHRREAEIFEIKMLDNGKPDLESVREIAPKVVLVQVVLNNE